MKRSKVIDASLLVVILIGGMFIGAFGRDMFEQMYEPKIKEEVVNKTIVKDSKIIETSVNYTPKNKPYSVSEMAGNCNGLNITETAECLKQNMATFYNYKVRSDEDKDFIDVRDNGGDCQDYSLIYVNAVDILGYESGYGGYSGLSKYFPGHRFAYIIDGEYSCTLDQLKVRCYKNGKKI